MIRGWFVTGTDTGVGKTLVAASLLQALAQEGRAVGMKPVASGCRVTHAGLRNADAETLMHYSNVPTDYAEVNPAGFGPAIAPHLAAQEAGRVIDVDALCLCFARLAARADYVVVEGVGGWCVPLSERTTTVDLAVRLGLPAILVVGLRLGCLNHALLTAESITAHGVTLAGWAGCVIDPGMDRVAENVATLEARLPGPCLGVIPHLPAPGQAHAEWLDWEKLVYP